MASILLNLVEKENCWIVIGEIIYVLTYLWLFSCSYRGGRLVAFFLPISDWNHPKQATEKTFCQALSPEDEEKISTLWKPISGAEETQ